MHKFCYFIGSPGGASAVSRQFEALGKELLGRGHEVRIISPVSEIDGDGGRRGTANLAWPSPRPTRSADALFLTRLIRRYHPDCMVANFAAVNWMCLIGWLLRVKHRIAFYHTLTSQLDRDTNGS